MIHQETEFLDKHLISCTTTTCSSISPSACDCVQLRYTSRSFPLWCSGNYSPHVLPRGPKATRKSKYPTYSLLGVTFPAGLGYNSFPAAANAVRQSHRHFGSEPWVGILFPYTWPMLYLLAILKQQILLFYSLSLFVKKPIATQLVLFFHYKQEAFFNYSKWTSILLEQILLLLLSLFLSNSIWTQHGNTQFLNHYFQSSRSQTRHFSFTLLTSPYI